jgi:hypothetical protein
MDYTQITGFLDKFKKIIFQKEELKNIVIKTISEEISFPIQNESVKIKDGFIFIKGSPLLRSEIMMKKNEIIRKIKDLYNDSNILDIK